jgi:hypothetical protein
MDDYLSTPLPMVNESNMKNFIGRYVIIHGKVSSIKNNCLFLSINPDANTDIIVKNFNQNVKQGATIKVIGKVYHDCSLEYLDCYQLGDEFDLKLLNDMIPVMHHKEVSSMFY